MSEGPRTMPAELETRIAALEAGASDQDFDLRSWIWMALFGVVVPAILLLLGG
jgi:hypothetical protein